MVEGLLKFKTVGVIEHDAGYGFSRMVVPVGVILALTPVTNPTSTVLYKSLMALKTRNSIIIAPHPSAAKCSVAAAEIIKAAAEKAGAPTDCVQVLHNYSRQDVETLMTSKDIGLIWATGGNAMVVAAMKSGRPCITGGAGNVPAVVDETADMPEAASQILLSKAFDNGMICASENSVVVVGTDARYRAFKTELAKRGGIILTRPQADQVRNIILGANGLVNADIVGKSAQEIGAMAGVKVDADTRALIAEVEAVGESEPWSHEKLSPLLAYAPLSFVSWVASKLMI